MVDTKESIPAHTPSFVIGAGGHQHLGDEKTRLFVMQQFRALLASYQQREPHLVLFSALAVGTDQLFVQIALDLGVRVEIVLPCAEYEGIFSSETEKQAYNRLLHAAQAIHQLPSQKCSDDAFLTAEQWIVDHSNLVILAWNGLPPQGRSGTGDIASYVRWVRRPFIHIDTTKLMVKTYGEQTARESPLHPTSPKQEFTVRPSRFVCKDKHETNRQREEADALPQPDLAGQQHMAQACKKQQQKAPRSALVTQGNQENNTSLFSTLSGWLLVYQQRSALIF